MASSKPAKPNNKSGKAKPTPAATKVGVGSADPTPNADAVVVLKKLKSEAEKLPRLIRPKYHTFDTPTSGECIIKKIPVGMRDPISERCTDKETGKLDNGMFALVLVAESLVFPVIAEDQVNLIDTDDFEIIFNECYSFSYLNISEAVARFRAANA